MVKIYAYSHVIMQTAVIDYKIEVMLISQTCIRQPLLGPLKSGCLGQVVIL